jgi:uncharacterized membrane protein
MQGDIVGMIAGIVLMRVLFSYFAERHQSGATFGFTGICMVTTVSMLRVGIELVRRRLGADKLQANHEEEQECRN